MSDLLSNNKSGWLGASDQDRGAIYDFSRAYMDFITSSKTERLIVEHAEQIARDIPTFVMYSGNKDLKDIFETYYPNIQSEFDTVTTYSTRDDDTLTFHDKKLLK